MDEIIKGLEEFYVKGKGDGRNVLKAIEFLYRIKENKCKLYKRLEALETEANKRIEEIPEPFEDLQDSENYNYYQGILETIKNIKEFLGGII